MFREEFMQPYNINLYVDSIYYFHYFVNGITQFPCAGQIDTWHKAGAPPGDHSKPRDSHQGFNQSRSLCLTITIFLSNMTVFLFCPIYVLYTQNTNSRWLVCLLAGSLAQQKCTSSATTPSTPCASCWWTPSSTTSSTAKISGTLGREGGGESRFHYSMPHTRTRTQARGL